MKLHLDHVLPHLAPLIGRALRAKQARRAAQFEALAPAPGRVVFLGDSLTEWGAWEDLFPELRTTNRGIGGQAVFDLMARLHTAIVEPTAVSLLIGTNDLHGLGKSSDVDAIADQAAVLVQAIRRMALTAKLLVNSVLPRSTHFRDRIVRLNDHLRRIAGEAGADYVDLWPAMAGADGAIRPEYTVDGLHLSVGGYKAWRDVLRPHLAPFAT